MEAISGLKTFSGFDVVHAKDSFYPAPLPVRPVKRTYRSDRSSAPSGATDPTELVIALRLANAVDVTRVIGGYCPGGKEFLEMMLALSPPSNLNQTR